MQKIEEIYWLRAYGCVAVFLFHWLDHLNQRVDNVVTDLMRIPLVLGTPVFLFISVFVFAVRYDKQVPPGFFMAASEIRHVALFNVRVHLFHCPVVATGGQRQRRECLGERKSLLYLCGLAWLFFDHRHAVLCRLLGLYSLAAMALASGSLAMGELAW